MNAAEERQTREKVAADLEIVAKLLRESREFALFIASPVVPAAKKSSVFRELLGTKVGNDVLTFFLLLTQKGREELIPDIVEQFRVLYGEKLGIVDVQVTSAAELAGNQKEELQRRLEKYTNKKVRMNIGVDGDVKGGLVIQVGDTVLDGSIRHQLELLRDRFLAGRTPS